MTTETPDPSRVLLGAIGRLLRPLVRLAIRHGITYPAMTDLLKHTYLDVVEEDLRRSGANPTDSRLSLLTGVHRKYVKQLRQQARTAPDAGEPRPCGTAGPSISMPMASPLHCHGWRRRRATARSSPWCVP